MERTLRPQTFTTRIKCTPNQWLLILRMEVLSVGRAYFSIRDAKERLEWVLEHQHVLIEKHSIYDGIVLVEIIIIGRGHLYVRSVFTPGRIICDTVGSKDRLTLTEEFDRMLFKVQVTHIGLDGDRIPPSHDRFGASLRCKYDIDAIVVERIDDQLVGIIDALELKVLIKAALGGKYRELQIASFKCPCCVRLGIVEDEKRISTLAYLKITL